MGIWGLSTLLQIYNQKNLSKLILCFTTFITKSLHTSEDTNNPVYTHITNKLQLLLVNVLIRYPSFKY